MQARIISPSASVILNLTRFLLALLVAGGHWTEHHFQQGWTDATQTAMRAVSGFFVISGFTIRMITSSGSFEPHKFLIDRFSRLWSVVLPALVVTSMLDYASVHLNPSYYLSSWGVLLQDPSPAYRLAANALFVNQLWGAQISPLSNSPFWSLGYEAWFYILFSLYAAKRSIPLLIAMAISGPSILFLMIPWSLGVWAYDVLERADSRRRLIVLGSSSFLLAAVLWALGARYSSDLHQYYALISNRYFAIFHASSGSAHYLYMAPSFVFTPGLLAFLSMAKFIDSFAKIPPAVSRVSTALGEFTFPLYLFHFPIFVLCAAIGFYDPHSPVQKIAIFLCICGLIFIITPMTTKLKNYLRKALFATKDFLCHIY